MKKIFLSLSLLLFVSCVNLDKLNVFDKKDSKVAEKNTTSSNKNVVNSKKEKQKKSAPIVPTKGAKSKKLLRDAEEISEDSYANRVKKYKAYNSLVAFNPSYKSEVEAKIGDLKSKIEDKTIEKAKVIIRSQASNQDIASILLEIEEFEKIYDEILQKASLISKPQLLYRQYEGEEMFLSKINTQVDLLITNDKQSIKTLEKSRFAPREIIYEKEADLFIKYGIDTEIRQLLDEKVTLKNGINLFIQSTEAMSIIDVNSAGYFKYKDFSQNAYHVNHLVCEEIVRQIRLRDISGVILIDFIDMRDEKLSKKLQEHLSKCLEKDDRKSTLSILSRSDIMQIIRKKEDITIEENLIDTKITLKNIEYIFEEVDSKIANVISEDTKKITIDIPIFESVKANNYLYILEKKYAVKINAKFLKKDDFNVKLKIEN